MFSQFDVKERQGETYSDNLKLYKARIYKVLGPKDDRLQVRIIPHMVDLPDSELSNLPRFPPFIKGQVIMGKTEVDDGALLADIVYVVATPDFQFGFVLGKTNYFGENTDSPMPDSYDFTQVKKFLTKRKILPDSFDYRNIVVQNWNENYDSDGNMTGGIMEFYNYKTGEKFILLTSGVIFALTQDKIYMRIGAGDSQANTGSKYSAMTMTASSILFKTAGNFTIDAQKVILGKRGMKVLSTSGGLIPFACDGQDISAASNVYV
jgi:hypothetical protein